MQFQESDIIFNFDPIWHARKYDDHRFYSRLSGAGLKAVDFITILHNRQLVFWEIKNFSRRKPELRLDPLQKIKDNQETFALDMSQKVKDTFRALNAIHHYYKRKWTYYPRKWLKQHLSNSQRNWYFWFRAYELSSAPENCKFILLAETDQGDQLPDFQWPIHKELSSLVSETNIFDVSRANEMEGIHISRANTSFHPR